MITSGHKIKGLIVFDTKDYLLAANNDLSKVFNPVVQNNSRLIKGFIHPGMSKKSIYIFFRTKRKSFKPDGPWLDTQSNVTYVPVNISKYHVDGQVPTKWVQDIFVQTSVAEIYYQPELMNSGLLKALLDTITKDIGVEFIAGNECQYDGGNIQEIEINNQPIIITGSLNNKENCVNPLYKLPLPYRKLAVKNVWHKKMAKFERPTHHLDMFFMWVGNTKMTSNCIIRSEAYFARPIKNIFKRVTINKAIRDGIDNGLKSLRVSMSIIDLPAMLFEDTNQSGKHFFSMTFANSIVENYSNGSPQVHLYLPDFTDTLKHLLRNESVIQGSYEKWSANVRLLFHFINEVFDNDENEQKRMSHQIAESKINQFNTDRNAFIDWFIEQMHKLVKKRVHRADNSIEIHFIANNFASYAEHYGGLHCLVKPIYE